MFSIFTSKCTHCVLAFFRSYAVKIRQGVWSPSSYISVIFHALVHKPPSVNASAVNFDYEYWIIDAFCTQSNRGNVSIGFWVCGVSKFALLRCH